MLGLSGFNKIACALCVLFLSVFCAMAQKTEGELEVVTTLFATYDFARQVGKDRVNVSLLLPPGVETHAFEPRPADIVRINRADVFIYTGKEMEPWVDKILKGITNGNLLVVDASQGIALAGGDDYDEDAGGGHEYGRYHHRGKDPHIWLDLGNARIMVDNIAQALSGKDPAGEGFYLSGARNYKGRLSELDGRFKESLSSCRHKTIICGGHFTFGYFAKRYGLKHISPYDGFSPNAEPGPRAIAELISRLRQSGVKCVYYEELLDPKVARVISRETGVSLELLHGAHNVSKDEFNRGVTFIGIMEDNLKKLIFGLECSPGWK